MSRKKKTEPKDCLLYTSGKRDHRALHERCTFGSVSGTDPDQTCDGEINELSVHGRIDDRRKKSSRRKIHTYHRYGDDGIQVGDL